MIDLPDTCIQNMISTPFISMVVLTTKTQITLQKHAFNKKMFTKKSSFLNFPFTACPKAAIKGTRSKVLLCVLVTTGRALREK